MKKSFAFAQNGSTIPQLQAGNAPKSGLQSAGGWACLCKTGALSLGAAPQAAPADHSLGSPPGSSAESQVCFPITARQSPHSTLQSVCQYSWGLSTGLSLLLPAARPGLRGRDRWRPDLVKSHEAVGAVLDWVWWSCGSWLLLRLRLPSPRTVPGMALSSWVQTVVMHYLGAI